MEFNLNITFGGMCLLVRDYEDAQLWILLPHVRDADHPHTATLHFNCGANVEQLPMPPLLDLRALPTMEKLVLDFPQRLLDLDYITREPVSRDLLQPVASSEFASVIVLDAGACVGASMGGRWRLGSRPPRFMATTVEWLITGISFEALSRLSESLDYNPNEVEKAYAQSRNSTLCIGIFNTPSHDKPSELPLPPPTDSLPTPRPDHQVRHFAAFYTLYQDPAGRPRPRFFDLGKQAKRIQVQNEIRGVDYTCIAATASAEERS